jgi:D-alanyl-D-alanine carboxypeptidase/D-alanyl-D-alanine-endopeptidase (penicillin-binding protein 4)
VGFPPTMARILCLAAVLAAALAPAAQAAGADATARTLDRQMRHAGAGSGAFAVDLDSGAVIYASAPDTPRIPASVNKLYTTAAALTRFGPDGQLETEVLAAEQPDEEGVVTGNLYLHGGGDPTFGRSEARGLANVLAGSGLTEVTGRVIGDESYFDGLRGGPASSYKTSSWVGPLSALTFNRGLTISRRPAFQGQPALYAAQQFQRALERAGVEVRRGARAGVAPADTVRVGEWASPRMSDLVGQTNQPSDNFMAETLLKALGAEFGSSGSTLAGTSVARDVAAEFDAHPRMVDGSGLSHSNRTTPRDVVELLQGMAESDVGDEFESSLAVAGRSGTLSDRMRHTAARDRCHAKTGTLIGVSALAGYCDGPSPTAFAFLMGGVTVAGAHALQDRMASALARYSSL